MPRLTRDCITTRWTMIRRTIVHTEDNFSCLLMEAKSYIFFFSSLPLLLVAHSRPRKLRLGKLDMGLFKRIFEFTISFLWAYDPSQQRFLDVPHHGGSLSQAAVPKGCVNSPTTRNCWIDGFDINTDYELSTPPGKFVEVWHP